MSTPRRFWQEMRSEEFGALDAARVIGLLPVGVVEQQGYVGNRAAGTDAKEGL